MGSEAKLRHWDTVLGRLGGAMIQSQENCLSDNHRFTHARWAGDFWQALFLLVLSWLCARIFLVDLKV